MFFLIWPSPRDLSIARLFNLAAAERPQHCALVLTVFPSNLAKFHVQSSSKSPEIVQNVKYYFRPFKGSGPIFGKNWPVFALYFLKHKKYLVHTPFREISSKMRPIFIKNGSQSLKLRYLEITFFYREGLKIVLKFDQVGVQDG